MIQSHSPENLEVPPARRRARRVWLYWIPAAFAAVALLVWAGSLWRAKAASAEVRSLAVLPFVDSSPQKEGDWFTSGVTGEVVDALQHVSGLKVMERNAPGIAAVIQGTIRHAGDRTRVDLRMTRTADRYDLWAVSLDQPSDHLNGLPRAIAEAIASRLQVRLDRASFARHQPSQEAYSAYLQGRYFLDRHHLDQAVERLEESTLADSEFALAWAWLSIAREYRVDGGMARPNHAMPASRDAAERAVALDQNCGDAHLALGIVKLQYDWDWPGAREELDRAVQASPGSPFAIQWRARWYETQGRINEAIAEAQRALALDPLSEALPEDLARQYLSANQAQRALPFAQKAAELQPDATAPRALLAEALFFAGQKEESRQVAAGLPATVRATVAAQQGDPSAARQLLNEAEDLPDEQLQPAVAYAQLAAATADWDRAFSWMAEAVGERDCQLPYLLWSPLILKSDPRFAGMLVQMNLPAATVSNAPAR